MNNFIELTPGKDVKCYINAKQIVCIKPYNKAGYLHKATINFVDGSHIEVIENYEKVKLLLSANMS